MATEYFDFKGVLGVTVLPETLFDNLIGKYTWSYAYFDGTPLTIVEKKRLKSRYPRGIAFYDKMTELSHF